jgi:RimJ/RimL family protein N-acetyltransferase
MDELEKSAPKVEGLQLRYTVAEDADVLRDWLLEPGILKAFPMADPPEVDDSVKHWIGFARYRCSLTALIDGKPAGIATLCLMPYRKLIHQCLVSIIVGKDYRNKGVGSVLLNNLLHLAKNYFRIEVLYLEVYEGNPAISLYRRFGFKECGGQKYFMKEDGKYVSKIIMERVL